MDDLKDKVKGIVEEARRKLQAVKGHALCTEDCDCPLSIRLVEDCFIHAAAALDRKT